MKKAQLTVFAMFWLSFSNAQILFTPSGLTGASTNSNVGIGTYLGDPNAQTDDAVKNAVKKSLWYPRKVK